MRRTRQHRCITTSTPSSSMDNTTLSSQSLQVSTAATVNGPLRPSTNLEVQLRDPRTDANSVLYEEVPDGGDH